MSKDQPLSFLPLPADHTSELISFQNMALGNIISRMSAKRAELHSEADQAARLAKELRAIELQMRRIEHALIAAFMDRYGLNLKDVDVQDKTGAT